MGCTPTALFFLSLKAWVLPLGVVLPGCDVVHLLGRALHMLNLLKEPKGVLGFTGLHWTPGAWIPGPRFPLLASEGINEAWAALYAGHTLVLYSSLSAARLLSFIAGCLPVSGADAQPDNEQCISLARQRRVGSPRGGRARASEPDLLFLHSQTKQNHWPARVIKDPGVVIETTFGARWLLMHE